MKLLTLFSRFGTDKYTDTHKPMFEKLQTLLPTVEHTFSIIDTALPEAHKQEENNIVLLGASNDDWEFGAWTHASQCFGKQILSYDYVLILTSACHCGYIDFHNFINEEILNHFSERAVALGHLEVYNNPVMFQNIRFQSWLRSSYILMSAPHFYMLQDLATVKKHNSIFSNDAAAPFLRSAAICEQYKEYISSWLTRPEGTGQGTTWHSQFALTQETLPFFTNKARAILNEMAITNRLKALGCNLIDLTYLHHNFANNLCQFPNSIPDWHKQIIERGTGHEFIQKK